MYFYKRTEPNLYTVGFEDCGGVWHPDSDWDTRGDAARQVSLLNGSNSGAYGELRNLTEILEQRIDALEKELKETDAALMRVASRR